MASLKKKSWNKRETMQMMERNFSQCQQAMNNEQDKVKKLNEKLKIPAIYCEFVG